MCQGWDLGVPWGVGDVRFFFFKIHSDLVCELLTWMAHAPAPFFGPDPLGFWGGDKRPKYHLIWITKSISKIFKPNFVYLLTNEIYITYHTGFSFGRLGHAQGWDLGVPWEVGGGSNFFSEIQPDLVCELLAWMAHAPAQFFGSSPPGALGRGQIINFWTWSYGISN